MCQAGAGVHMAPRDDPTHSSESAASTRKSRTCYFNPEHVHGCR